MISVALDISISCLQPRSWHPGRCPLGFGGLHFDVVNFQSEMKFGSSGSFNIDF